MAYSFFSAPPETNIVTINKLELSPDPITLPGELNFTFDGYSSGMSPSSLKVSLQRRGNDGKMYRIACILHIGTW